DQASLIGRSLDTVPLMAAVAETALNTEAPAGAGSFTAADGARRQLNLAPLPRTQSPPFLSIDASQVTAPIHRAIRSVYIQLVFVCLFVLPAALIGAEKLIIEPIGMMTDMAKRFGESDWSARVAYHRLPAEFVPLARAFNAMAARLSQREREMVAN